MGLDGFERGDAVNMSEPEEKAEMETSSPDDNETQIKAMEAERAAAEAKYRAAKQEEKNRRAADRAKTTAAIGKGIKKMSKKAKIAVGVVVLAVVVVLVAIVPGVFSKNQAVTISEVSLKQAVNISKLSTAEFSYKGIATKNDDSGNPSIYIYYEATANTSVDMSQIDFVVDETGKTITPTIPPVSIDGVVIDESSLDFLPKDADADMREVIELCKADMWNEATQNPNLIEAAENNLKATIEALLMPILGDEGYSIVWGEGQNDATQEGTAHENAE